MSKKIISFSLYGSSPVYYQGMIANAQLAPEVFPGWTVRIYHERLPFDMEIFKHLKCELIEKRPSRMHAGMFWRFLAAWEPAERVIFRDADSRLNIREAAAIKEWEGSGLNAHEMKDHPHHSRLPISGGMWGIKCGILPQDMKREVLRKCRQRQQRVKDMYWLRDRVHPLIESSLLRHSSVKTKWPYVPFPKHPKYRGFCGQQYDEKGNGIWPKL